MMLNVKNVPHRYIFVNSNVSKWVNFCFTPPETRSFIILDGSFYESSGFRSRKEETKETKRRKRQGKKYFYIFLKILHKNYVEGRLFIFFNL